MKNTSPTPRRVKAVQITTDDRAAREVALEAEIFAELAGVAPSPRRMALAMRRLPHGRSAAVFRFMGWPDTADNGWAAIVGPHAAVVAAAASFVAEHVELPTLRTLADIRSRS
jgi:hypothetical protein